MDWTDLSGKVLSGAALTVSLAWKTLKLCLDGWTIDY